MTDRIETVIAEQLAKNLWDRLTNGPRWIGSDEFQAVLEEEARSILAALKAARIAVVELPEPDKYGRFWYGNHCNYTFADTGEVETSRVYQRIDPPTLREYAAALLAAADAAEVSQ
ncbi:hypothetical protein [Mycolicibacterium setense]|uniref:hypothetical protein n=1 Tax=Mycolicibacterium setense TaxID=431269 RepID=UPI000A5E809A|nr:hypothetical protein [Mycolicibacterium setense]